MLRPGWTCSFQEEEGVGSTQGPHSGAREKSDTRVWSVLSVRQSVKLPYENLCKLGLLNEVGERE